jgi:hypothetical protein
MLTALLKILFFHDCIEQFVFLIFLHVSDQAADHSSGGGGSLLDSVEFVGVWGSVLLATADFSLVSNSVAVEASVFLQMTFSFLGGESVHVHGVWIGGSNVSGCAVFLLWGVV